MTAARKKTGHHGITEASRGGLAWLEKQIKLLDKDLDRLIRQSPLWRVEDDLLVIAATDA